MSKNYGIGKCLMRDAEVIFPDRSERGSLWKHDNGQHYARVDGLNYVVEEDGLPDTIIAKFHGDVPIYQGFSVDADLVQGFQGF